MPPDLPPHLPPPPPPEQPPELPPELPPSALLQQVQRHIQRQRRAEAPPTLARQLASIGVLGWLVVTPLLGGLALGRWLDARAGSGLFWTAPLLLLGLGLGCWMGWRWMQGKG